MSTQSYYLKEIAENLKVRFSRGENGGSYDQEIARFREEIATVRWDAEKGGYVRAWKMPAGSLVPVVSKFSAALAAWQA